LYFDERTTQELIEVDKQMADGLIGKVEIVTGAFRGIGRATG